MCARLKRSFQWILWICLMSAAMSAGQASTLTVGPAAQFQSIQNAIAAAQAGDVIAVRAGTYNENLLIDKQLSLIGINRPIVHGNGNGSVVVITAGSCLFRGFQLEHSGSDLQT